MDSQRGGVVNEQTSVLGTKHNSCSIYMLEMVGFGQRPQSAKPIICHVRPKSPSRVLTDLMNDIFGQERSCELLVSPHSTEQNFPSFPLFFFSPFSVRLALIMNKRAPRSVLWIHSLPKAMGGVTGEAVGIDE